MTDTACETCGGSGWVSSVSGFPVPCPDCTGEKPEYRERTLWREPEGSAWIVERGERPYGKHVSDDSAENKSPITGEKPDESEEGESGG
jgi:hypothetical protein